MCASLTQRQQPTMHRNSIKAPKNRILAPTLSQRRLPEEIEEENCTNANLNDQVASSSSIMDSNF